MIYTVPRTAAQLRHVEGAPIGTRGGTSVVHIFPADGEYTFRMMMHSIPTGQLYGSTTRGEQIEISINGEREALLDINPRMSEVGPEGHQHRDRRRSPSRPGRSASPRRSSRARRARSTI